jgi:hypothetical protein
MPACEHLPCLSEPSLTLCCTLCGVWLKHVEQEDGTVTYEVVPREQACRGTHVCPRCKKEWIGNEEWCEDCEAPTWA